MVEIKVILRLSCSQLSPKFYLGVLNEFLIFLWRFKCKCNFFRINNLWYTVKNFCKFSIKMDK